jgi:hypothetical protein
MKCTTLFHQVKKTGLSDEQALLTLHVVGNYAKEKFPILEGNINAFLKQEFRQADPLLVEKLFDNHSSSRD